MKPALKWMAAGILAVTTASPLLAGSGGVALGAAGDPRAVSREIQITTQTRWINVESGETVRFVDGATGRSLVWRFDTPSWATGNLHDFAPDMARGRTVRVYVAEPELYKSDI